MVNNRIPYRQPGFETLETRQLLAADLAVNFQPDYLQGHDPRQDVNGAAVIEESGAALRLSGNTWKVLQVHYDVTPYTILEFDFESVRSGELQGIGVDTDRVLDRHDVWFNLIGSQTITGIRDFEDNGQSVRSVSIPLGRYARGAIHDLIFANDHDVPSPDAESVFRNVRLYEGGYELDDVVLLDYSPHTHANTGTVAAAAREVELHGSRLAAVAAPYTVTSRTRLRFEADLQNAGELSGIGVDTDLQLQATDTFFRLAGSDTATGIGDLIHPEGGAFEIPLGSYFQGEIEYLTFGTVDTAENASATFRNIRLFEGQVELTTGDLVSYDLAQDVAGTAHVDADGTVVLQGNTWKAAALPYQVTPNTMLEFDFSSTTEGELHGIGIDDNLAIDDYRNPRWFALYGTQSFFAPRQFEDYAGSGARRYVIPIGEVFSGAMQYLVFGNDDDVAEASDSRFNNIRLYESDIVGLNMPQPVAVVNSGTPGANTNHGLSKFQNDVLAHDPDHVVFAFGMNDLANSAALIPVAQFRANLQQMIDGAKAIHARSIVLVTVNPVIEEYLFERHPTHPHQHDFPSHHATYNAAIRELAEENQLLLADWSAWVDERGGATTDPGSLIRNEANASSRDGVHPTQQGYADLGRLVGEQLEHRVRAGDVVVAFGDSITTGLYMPGAGTAAGATYPAWMWLELNRAIWSTNRRSPLDA